MLDTDTQAQFAEATAELFDFYARTGTRLAWASADQGMALWLGALRLAAKRADARLNEWRGAFIPWMDLRTSVAPRSAESPAQERQPSEPAYASYRTAGGHAAAQVAIARDPAYGRRTAMRIAREQAWA